MFTEIKPEMYGTSNLLNYIWKHSKQEINLAGCTMIANKEDSFDLIEWKKTN